MRELYLKAAEAIKSSKNLIALTGAGISVESGIPDFRSPGGLWQRFDPFEYAHIDSFAANPEKTWKMVFALKDLTQNSKPNPAHIALAKLEKMGLLKAVITQNIDNLHQEGGSKNVIEFHGNASRLECLKCRKDYISSEFTGTMEPPKCSTCGSVLKPGFIFFGEMIPYTALTESRRLASQADAMLVIGTSAVVQPAASMPFFAKDNGAVIIEMNRERTNLTGHITDIFIEGQLGQTLPALLQSVAEL